MAGAPRVNCACANPLLYQVMSTKHGLSKLHLFLIAWDSTQSRFRQEVQLALLLLRNNDCFHSISCMINSHITALFTWHDFSSEIHTYIRWLIKCMQLVIRSLVILTHAKYRMQYCDYWSVLWKLLLSSVAAIQVCKRIYSDWFLVRPVPRLHTILAPASSTLIISNFVGHTLSFKENLGVQFEHWWFCKLISGLWVGCMLECCNRMAYAGSIHGQL